ncbi:PCMD domain-containing protein [uncultured Sunxiuqinia sp.]|uniref:PCMD domain-containing protein n=1 Tax=uncultured Sunxiuqinia sp. TaxID=1573825 RepID=UPI0026323706|nr:PCMD domain-containing protein [uncultured Sunxiuqinia sp.]
MMKSIDQLIIALLLVSFTAGCVKEDHFGFSDGADILSLELSNQNGTPFIDRQNDSLYVEVANGTDLSQLVVKSLELSPFAKATIAVGDTLDFSESSELRVGVTAESGAVSSWSFNVFELGSQPQISNSDFNTWHNRGTYLDLGVDDESSAWGTSNPGAVFGGITPNVQQLEMTTGDYAVKLTTRFTWVGSLVGKPIASGSVFTGDFQEGNISFDNPQAAVKFGIPFTATPASFSVDYQYTPGEKNMDASQNALPYADTGDMYILLERREEEQVKRVATAWFRIEEGTSSMKNITVNFTYGQLPAGSPEYMLPGEGETYAAEGEVPTHIVAVFSSSANGNDYEGAENSVLIIDNLVLNY